MAFTSPSNPDRVPAAPVLCGRILRLVPLYSNCSYKLKSFFSVPQGRKMCSHSLRTILPDCSSVSGMGAPFVTRSLSLAVLHLVYLLLHGSYSVSPRFFLRRNWSINRCRLGVSWGGGEFSLPMLLSWARYRIRYSNLQFPFQFCEWS